MGKSPDVETIPVADKPPRRKRWIPVSLRLWLVILLLFAIAAAWIVVRGSRQAAIVRRIREAGGRVEYYGQFDNYGNWISHAQPRGPTWLRKKIGNDFFDEPFSVHIKHANSDRPVPEAARNVVPQIARLSRLKSLSIDGVRLTEADLAAISKMSELRDLDLGQGTLDDFELEPLRGLAVESLGLPRTRVSDKGLLAISQMRSLRYLDLTRTRVTDEGVLSLADLPNLRLLRLNRSKVTLEGAKRLKARLPQCEIVWESLELGNVGPSIRLK
jgi:Leucine Rich repeat